MLNLPENELFSAYIDGELTADEQAEVEQILNDNPEAQQLVDELRSLSLSLQALPAYKLDEDLAERVLRQAEREMLAHPAVPLPKFHQVDVPEANPHSWARRLLRPRNFAWSAVAIVVAVVLVLNESDTNNGTPDNVALTPRSVTIKPLDIVPTVDAVGTPPVPTVVQASKAEEPARDAPDAVAPATEPTMVAETLPDANRQPNKQPAATAKDGATPLLVLECQLADGRIGHESLAELLKEAGIAVDQPFSEDGAPVEFTLTTDQVRQVVSQLQAGTGDFTAYSFLPTAGTAPPRIPISIGAGGPHSEQTTAAEENQTKEPANATFHVQGTITIQQQAATPANPAETTGADGSSANTKAPAKTATAKTLKSLPVKDDSTYRVRFVLKSPEKAAKSEPPADK